MDYFRRNEADDPWFRVGTIEVTTTVLVTGLVVVSWFIWAFARQFFIQLPFATDLARSGELWRMVTWPLANPLSSIIIFELIGLFFFFWFGRELERTLGRVRFLLFLGFVTILPAVVGLLVDSVGYGIGMLGQGVFLTVVLRHRRERTFFELPFWAVGAALIGLNLLQLVGDGAYQELRFMVLELVAGALAARSFGLVDDIAWIPRIPLPSSWTGEPRRAPSRPAKAPRRSRQRRGEAEVVTLYPQQPTVRDLVDQADIDNLLDKISAQGIDSLTPDERRRLNEHSKRLRDDK